jgi:hypothetical protein
VLSKSILAPQTGFEPNTSSAYILDSPYLSLPQLFVKFSRIFTGAEWYNKSMNSSKSIDVDENSPEFLLDLERRIKLAKNPKNRIPHSIAKKDILEKYQDLADKNHSVNTTSDVVN